MGENIGDVGWLTMAYHGYKLALGGKEAPVIGGFTGDQRFFLAWAQVWKRKYREEELINRLKSDPHSPAEFRVNGVVRNMSEWYTAFDVKEGDTLYLPPEDRVSTGKFVLFCRVFCEYIDPLYFYVFGLCILRGIKFSDSI